MIAAVAFGLSFQWPNIANLTGYTRELLDKFVLQGIGHIQIFQEGHKYFDPAPVIPVLKDETDIQAIYPRLRVYGIVLKVDRRVENLGIPLMGVSPSEWSALLASTPAGAGSEKTSALKVRKGAKTGEHFLIGRKVAQSLRLGPGDRLELLALYRNRPIQIRISSWSIPDYGYQAEKSVQAELSFLQKTLGARRHVSEVSVLFSPHRAKERRLLKFTRRFQERFAGDARWRARPWWHADEFVANAIQGNKILAIISSLMVLGGVSIPLFALLYVGVVQDREGIALLSGLGFTRGQIFLVYLIRGLLIALLGVLMGTLCGYAILMFFEHSPIYESLSFTIRPSWGLEDLLFSFTAVFFIAVFSGILPAYQATRVNPVQVLRGE